MENYEIQRVLMDALPFQEVYVTSNANHFQIVAIGEIFNGMSRVKKQQTIYTLLMKYIADNRIHSLSIKAYTPQEWKHIRKLNDF